MAKRLKHRIDRKSFSPPPLSDKLLKEFGSANDFGALNALLIANSIFGIEQELRKREIRKLVIPLFHANGNKSDLKTLTGLLHDLLVFTLVEDIDIEFRRAETQLSFDYMRSERSGSRVCLFSGGTDSYSGLLVTEKEFGEVKGVFCAHADQSRIIRIVENLQKNILRGRDLNIEKIGVPAIGSRGYAQLRGFLYLLTAVAMAHKVGAEEIVITECGPTMFQPRFSPLDAVTMTTHPFVVRTAARVGQLLVQRNLSMITPFEDLTKAEVISISPDKRGFKYTHSCISQRFGTHDGTCYGCVIRRLATIGTDVQDVKYNRNPIADPSANAGNLYTLLTFCYEVLTGFRYMEEYERGMIDAYRKRDLFRRFALDNFAAVHRLISENKRVVKPIRIMYESLISKVGVRQLDSRLRELAVPSVGPNFRRRT